MVDSLRGARTALEENLITEEDFDSIKVAYLKAQQYRAGLDAGFIEKADYAEVKARFLDDVSRMSIAPVTSNSASPVRQALPGTDSQAAIYTARTAICSLIRFESPPVSF